MARRQAQKSARTHKETLQSFKHDSDSLRLAQLDHVVRLGHVVKATTNTV